MNKQRRDELQGIEGKLGELRELLEGLRDEEQEYFDNMPDNLQDGERGTAAENAVSNMDEAISDIESAQAQIEDTTEQQ